MEDHFWGIGINIGVLLLYTWPKWRVLRREVHRCEAHIGFDRLNAAAHAAGAVLVVAFLVLLAAVGDVPKGPRFAWFLVTAYILFSYLAGVLIFLSASKERPPDLSDMLD